LFNLGGFMRRLFPSNRTCMFFLLILFYTLATSVPSHAVLPAGNNSPFTQIYEKVAPSVVLIEVESEAPKAQTAPFNPWERFFNIPIPQQQQQQSPRQGMGSGVIIDRQGNIITNNHVIEDATKINVKISETEQYKATLVGKDPESDIAVIRLNLDGKLLPESYVAELGDSDTLKPGDYAIAIGNPIGLERTITVGVISAIGRHGLQVQGKDIRFQNFIQTDAQINPGNSGGALVDINGKVIGINNIYVAQLAAIGFAVPINLAKSIAFKLVKDGKIKRGFVGIWSEKKGITKEIQEAMNLPSTDGVLIQEIEPGSPAEKAGLNHGDVIITLDGVKIKNFQDFLFKIAEHAPGDTVTLEILRNGTKQEMKLTLADSDDFMNVTAGYSSENAWRGINVADLNSQIAQQYNLDGIENGVVVVKIDKNSPAEDSNLAEGDVIIEIEGRSVKDVKDFNSIKNDVKNTKKPILIYRLRKTSNGIMKGYVAVKSE